MKKKETAFNIDNVIKLLQCFSDAVKKSKKLNEHFDHGSECFKEFAMQVRTWFFANEVTMEDIIQLQHHGLSFMEVNGVLGYIRKNEKTGLFYNEAVELCQKFEFLKLTIAESKGEDMRSLLGDIRPLNWFYEGDVYSKEEVEFFKSLPATSNWDKKLVIERFNKSGITLK